MALPPRFEAHLDGPRGENGPHVAQVSAVLTLYTWSNASARRRKPCGTLLSRSAPAVAMTEGTAARAKPLKTDCHQRTVMRASRPTVIQELRHGDNQYWKWNTGVIRLTEWDYTLFQVVENVFSSIAVHVFISSSLTYAYSYPCWSFFVLVWTALNRVRFQQDIKNKCPEDDWSIDGLLITRYTDIKPRQIMPHSSSYSTTFKYPWTFK